MEEPPAAAGGEVSLHNFSARLWEQLVHFHVMRLTDSLFLWVGATPHLRNLAVAMCNRYDSIPVSTSLLGDTSDTTSTGLAQRLGCQQSVPTTPTAHALAHIALPGFETPGSSSFRSAARWNVRAHPGVRTVSTKDLLTLAFRAEDVELKGRVPTFTDRPPLRLGSSFVGHGVPIILHNLCRLRS
ncbi:proteasome assembly chaperone 4 isoform X1 [Meles meles]|uniref:proteasome assembly chaperone 4 isoform X1 n=1 Tax=Meles meles TaxID=9662 RepID=UPI001E69CE83|nr:proteasome assembly chaperone 4 isoform X1 [Meles meles]